MGRFTDGVSAVVRQVLAREELPPAPPPPARPTPLASLRRLLGPEPLPPPPEVPDTSATPGRRPVRALLAPEPLPPDLPPLARRRGRWLAWLFAPESLDP